MRPPLQPRAGTVAREDVAEPAQTYPQRQAGAIDQARDYLEQAGDQAFPGKGHLKPTDEYVRTLERELTIVQQERDILKKALAIFTRSQR